METITYSKVTRRIIPFLFICYIFCFIDRVNVGFAILQMKGDLGFSEAVYGLGAGIFFIGYFIFEIPSNLLLEKIGPRIWIGRIMVTWGVVSSMTMLVGSPESFYFCRFLLGVMEAGFFPGIILYLTYWYPASKRAHTTALFMTAIPVSGIIGGIVSGWVLHYFSGIYGLSGWQWLFLLEGVPVVLLGIATFFYLDDGIDSAGWLTQKEKDFLRKEIELDEKNKSRHSLKDGLLDFRVWVLSLVYFCSAVGLYGINFWLPQIVRNTGVESPLNIGLITAIPNCFAIIVMLIMGRSSDRRHERRWHLFICSLIASIGFISTAAYGSSTIIAVASLGLSMAGIMSFLSIFWGLPTAILTGTAAASGIALINSVGNLGGFASPYMLGRIHEVTKSLDSGFYFIALLLFTGGVFVMILGRPPASSRF